MINVSQHLVMVSINARFKKIIQFINFLLYSLDGKILQKACKSELTNDKILVCDSTTNINCIKCEANNCNTHTERNGNNCFQCEGTACLLQNIPSAICLKDEEGKSDCYTGINGIQEHILNIPKPQRTNFIFRKRRFGKRLQKAACLFAI